MGCFFVCMQRWRGRLHRGTDFGFRRAARAGQCGVDTDCAGRVAELGNRLSSGPATKFRFLAGEKRARVSPSKLRQPHRNHQAVPCGGTCSPPSPSLDARRFTNKQRHSARLEHGRVARPTATSAAEITGLEVLRRPWKFGCGLWFASRLLERAQFTKVCQGGRQTSAKSGPPSRVRCPQA